MATPKICTECNQSFQNKSNLNRHVKRMHVKTFTNRQVNVQHKKYKTTAKESINVSVLNRVLRLLLVQLNANKRRLINLWTDSVQRTPPIWFMPLPSTQRGPDCVSPLNISNRDDVPQSVNGHSLMTVPTLGTHCLRLLTTLLTLYSLGMNWKRTMFRSHSWHCNVHLDFDDVNKENVSLHSVHV
jgi:hypothetical protein